MAVHPRLLSTLDLDTGGEYERIPGPQGDPGAPGADGDQGIQGIQGIQGVEGPPGAGSELPVGSVYIAVVSTNPATLLGYGTWSAIATGQVLVGFNTDDPDFDAAEATGGSKTVASAGSNAAEAAHTHSVTSDVTSGTANAALGLGQSVLAPTLANNAVVSGAGSSHNHAFTGSATSVVQPFCVVYIWKRTA